MQQGPAGNVASYGVVASAVHWNPPKGKENRMLQPCKALYVNDRNMIDNGRGQTRILKFDLIDVCCDLSYHPAPFRSP